MAASREEFEPLAQELELSPRAVEDTIIAHQKPKLVPYDDSLFVVLKPARYLDESKKVKLSEVHVFVGKDLAVTVRHGEISALDEVRRQLEDKLELLRQGPQPILHAIVDEIVDEYVPVLERPQRFAVRLTYRPCSFVCHARRPSLISQVNAQSRRSCAHNESH